LYTGSWDGYFYALDAHTGQLNWKFRLDCQLTVIPVPEVCGGPPPGPDPRRFQTPGGIVTATPAVFGDAVYFAGGKTVYAVKASDGSLLWKRVICGRPEDPDCAADANDPTQVLSSPAVFDGKLFFGAASGGVTFGIPYRGGFVALDAKTGNLIWRFEVDRKVDANGHIDGVQNRGCGDVWSSPAVDPKLRLVFFGTADCEEQPLPPYHESVLALDADTGHLRWIFRPRETDPDQCDFDFGASPNLIELAGKKFIGIGGKDGTYYLLDRLTGQSRWATRVVFGGDITRASTPSMPSLGLISGKRTPTKASARQRSPAMSYSPVSSVCPRVSFQRSKRTLLVRQAASCSSSTQLRSMVSLGWSIQRSFRSGPQSSSGQGIFSTALEAVFMP
jgi:polyvinyl alcohol dehydrogenase (cytochrome)